MEQENSRRLTRAGSLALASCAILAAAISSPGCSDSESRTTRTIGIDEANAVAAPSTWSLEELPVSLELAAEQSVAMREAIAQLNTDSQRLHEEFRRGRTMGERRSARGVRPESPVQTFLATSSKTLSTDQFLILCDHLASQRAERHRDRIRRREGHRVESARSENRRGHHDKGRFSRVSHKLGLSPEQVRQLHEVCKEYRERSGALFASVASGTLTADAGAAQATKFAQSKRADLWTILTSEQLTKLDEGKQGRIVHGVDRRLKALDTQLTRRAEFLARVLLLSEDQARQAEQILLTSIPERERNLIGVRDGTIDSQVAALKGIELEQQVLAELRSILTEDQLKRLDAIRDLVPGGINASARHLREHS